MKLTIFNLVPSNSVILDWWFFLRNRSFLNESRHVYVREVLQSQKQQADWSKECTSYGDVAVSTSHVHS